MASNMVDHEKQLKYGTGGASQAAGIAVELMNEYTESLCTLTQEELLAKIQSLQQENEFLREEAVKLTMDNAYLRSTNEKMRKIDEELPLSDDKMWERIEQLDKDNTKLREEIQALSVQLMEQKEPIRSLRSDLDGLQNALIVRQVGNVARQVGIAAEQAVIKYIFPNCTTRLYRIRSLHVLKVFLSDPEGTAESTDLCGESAAENYRRFVSEEGRMEINRRFQQVQENFPTLRDSIKDLKDCASSVYPPHGDVQELLECYPDEEDLRIALLVCKSVTDSLATTEGNQPTELGQS